MKLDKPAANIICQAAKLESKFKNTFPTRNALVNDIQRKNKVGTGESIFTPGHVYTYLVSIKENPISLKDFKELKPEIRATRGFYTIQYIPSGSYKRNPKFPYLIGQDLVRLRVTVSGPAHWKKLCERVPELAWIDRNSTLTMDMFEIAKKHPGLILRFGINFSKYCKMIEDKAKRRHIDIDHKPLVLYQWGADEVPQVEDGVLAPVKTKKDYEEALKELQEGIDGEEDI